MNFDSLPERYCQGCGAKLKLTISYQGKHIHRNKTMDRWQKKQYCNGGCATSSHRPVNTAIDAFLGRRL